MSSRCLRLLAALVAPALSCLAGEAPKLRVCADPNNLPFSNDRGEGFENKLAEMIARDFGAAVEYKWWPQRKTFLRYTLEAGACDVVPGIPTAVPSVLATRPYYRSSYVFVSRKDRGYRIASFDDPALAKLRIGVHVVDDGFAPPAQALARRGLNDHLVAFSLYGPEGQPNPPARIIDAVERGDVDLAIAWGPLAGYFARREPVPLDVSPVPQPPEMRMVPFAYDISLGVRKDDPALRAKLDAELERRKDDIRRLLDEYGIPRVEN